MPLSTQQFNSQQPITTPQAGYKFYQPWFEDYQRRVGASAFGSDGIGGLMNQAQPVPVEGTAGLTPLQMQSRQTAMSAGPDMGAYNTATNLMGQGAGMIGQGADALGTAQGMYGQGTNLVGQGSGLYGLGTQMTGQAANMFAPGAAQQQWCIWRFSWSFIGWRKTSRKRTRYITSLIWNKKPRLSTSTTSSTNSGSRARKSSRTAWTIRTRIRHIGWTAWTIRTRLNKHWRSIRTTRSKNWSVRARSGRAWSTKIRRAVQLC